MTTRQKNRGSKKSDEKRLTVGQEQMLAAYLETPSAAEVARRLNRNEDAVSRFIRENRDEVDRRMAERDRERQQMLHARTARLHRWADETLQDVLVRLDEMAASQDDRVALNAIKVKLSMFESLGLAKTVPAEASSLAALLEEATEEVARELAGLAEEEGESDD